MENHPEIKTIGQLKAAALKAACNDHIWVNAFTLIRPTEKIYAEIGKLVVDMLKNRENLLPSYTEGPEKKPVSAISRLSNVLYMSINQS